MKHRLKKLIQFITNPRLVFCFAIAWGITNGWSYVLFAVGAFLGIDWMTAIGGAYLAFLWLPVSPEKLMTFAIAIFLLKRWFPNDQKTLAVLKEFRDKTKQAIRKKKEEHKEKERKTKEHKTKE